MEQQKSIIVQAERFVQEAHGSDGSGHDWWHIHRVRNSALALARKEQADLFVCELAALLHDVADEKLNPSKEAGLAKVRGWLDEHVSDQSVIIKVIEIISTMSYNGGKNPPMSTLEGQIVQDGTGLTRSGLSELREPLLMEDQKVGPCTSRDVIFRRLTTAAQTTLPSIIFTKSC